jgi:hypothetical protein
MREEISKGKWVKDEENGVNNDDWLGMKECRL